MAQNVFILVLTDETQDFIDGLPEAVSYKIFYNTKRVAGGRTQQGTFQEVGKYGDMGVPHAIQQDRLSPVRLLGQGRGDFGDCHAWHHQKNLEYTQQGVTMQMNI